MNVSHTTIKDKEIPRWQPLQRVALSKLSPKRLVLLILALATLLFLLSSSFITGPTPPSSHEIDTHVTASLRQQLRSMVNLRGDFSLTTRPTAIFVTAHALHNATGLTGLACEMAAAKKMNVLMVFMGGYATDKIPMFLRANGFDGGSCPMVWHDARYEYYSLDNMKEAAAEILDDAVKLVSPSAVVYVDDEEEWFMGSLEKSVFWRRPSISLIQLKRAALHNLRWIASLTPHALAGSPHCKYPVDFSLEHTANRCRYNDVARKHRHTVSTNRITPLCRIHPSYPTPTLHYIQSQHHYN